MRSNFAQNTLASLLAVVTVVLLVAAGFLARVVMESDAGPVQRIATPEVTESADPATPTAAGIARADGVPNQDPGLLEAIIGILEAYFVEPDRLDRQLLYDGAIDGLFRALGDPHSGYIDAQTCAVSCRELSGAFEGIGATVAHQGDYVVVASVLPGTPAERAGIRAGDVIVAVDGEDAGRWSVEQAVLRIRGERGSAVELAVRHIDGAAETITIVRDNILVASVDTAPPGGVLRDSAGDEVTDIGYIRIRSFTARTPQELTGLIERLEDGDGIGAIILDVRGNPGGLLAQTTETADLFLDTGTIVVHVDRAGSECVYRADRSTVTDLPIAIVQDEFPASGSEVLAAAIQENDRGIVVGASSFGKGTVNRAHYLSNGGAVYVSTARWLTPDRNLIEGHGVIPDIGVTLAAEDDRDVAVHRAIDALRALQGGST